MRLRKPISALTAAVAASAVLAVVPSGPADAATPPSTTPAVPHSYYATANFPSCGYGHVCADVKYGSGYYYFDFYKFGTYSLSHWMGVGTVENHQTGVAAIRTYDNNGRQIRCIKPGSAFVTFDWTPVWSIKLTSSGC